MQNMIFEKIMFGIYLLIITVMGLFFAWAFGFGGDNFSVGLIMWGLILEWVFYIVIIFLGLEKFKKSKLKIIYLSLPFIVLFLWILKGIFVYGTLVESTLVLLLLGLICIWIVIKKKKVA